MTELQNLIGKKITIFKYSDFGFPHSIQCEMRDVFLQDYAQYKNLVHIVYRPKGKKTDYVCRVYDYSTILIYVGWVDLKADMYVETLKSSEDVTVRRSLLSFSNEYAEIAMQSTNQKPVFSQIK